MEMNSATVATTGVARGSMICQKMRNWEAPSTMPDSRSSSGRPKK